VLIEDAYYYYFFTSFSTGLHNTHTLIKTRCVHCDLFQPGVSTLIPFRGNIYYIFVISIYVTWEIRKHTHTVRYLGILLCGGKGRCVHVNGCLFFFGGRWRIARSTILTKKRAFFNTFIVKNAHFNTFNTFQNTVYS